MMSSFKGGTGYSTIIDCEIVHFVFCGFSGHPLWSFHLKVFIHETQKYNLTPSTGPSCQYDRYILDTPHVKVHPLFSGYCCSGIARVF